MNLLLGSFSLGHERRFFVFSAAIWNTLHVGVKFSKAIKANCSSPQERKPYQLYGQYQFCSHFHSSACFTEVLELVSGTDNCRQLISLFEEFPVHMPFLCLFPRDGLFEPVESLSSNVRCVNRLYAYISQRILPTRKNPLSLCGGERQKALLSDPGLALTRLQTVRIWFSLPERVVVYSVPESRWHCPGSRPGPVLGKTLDALLQGYKWVLASCWELGKLNEMLRKGVRGWGGGDNLRETTSHPGLPLTDTEDKI